MRNWLAALVASTFLFGSMSTLAAVRHEQPRAPVHETAITHHADARVQMHQVRHAKKAHRHHHKRRHHRHV